MAEQPISNESDELVVEHISNDFVDITYYKRKDDGKLDSTIERNKITGLTSHTFYDTEHSRKANIEIFGPDGKKVYEEIYSYSDTNLLTSTAALSPEGTVISKECYTYTDNRELKETTLFNAAGEHIGIEDDLTFREALYQDARGLGATPEEARAAVSQISNAEIRARMKYMLSRVDENSPQ